MCTLFSALLGFACRRLVLVLGIWQTVVVHVRKQHMKQIITKASPSLAVPQVDGWKCRVRRGAEAT